MPSSSAQYAIPNPTPPVLPYRLASVPGEHFNASYIPAEKCQKPPKRQKQCSPNGDCLHAKREVCCLAPDVCGPHEMDWWWSVVLWNVLEAMPAIGASIDL